MGKLQSRLEQYFHTMLSFQGRKGKEVPFAILIAHFLIQVGDQVSLIGAKYKKMTKYILNNISASQRTIEVSIFR